MGEGVEMMRRMGSRLTAALGLALGLAVSGCGNQGEGQQGSYAKAFSVAREQIKLRRGARAAPAAVRPQLNRAALAGVKSSLLSARFDNGSSGVTMFVTARSGPYLTWKTLSGVTISTKNDVIHQTRGFANDLMSVGSQPVQAYLRGGVGRGERVYRHLAEDNKMRRIAMVCDVTNLGAERIVVLELGHATRHLQEVCTATDGPFDGQRITNDYWVGGDGTIWASRQWLGPELGHIRMERYIR